MAMQKIAFEGRSIWVGNHPQLGLVIYDPEEQDRVTDESWVSLFRVSESAADLFYAPTVRSTIKQPSPQQIEDLPKVVSQYSERLQKAAAHQTLMAKADELRRGRRSAFCYSCKASLVATDRSVCPKCKWIKCSCGACGCSI